MVFFTVLCLYVTYFQRGAQPEICGYLTVQIWLTDCTKVNVIGATRITHASALHQTMYHTQSNLFGPLSVGSQLLFKSDDVNPP